MAERVRSATTEAGPEARPEPVAARGGRVELTRLASAVGNRQFARIAQHGGRVVARTTDAEARLAQIENELGSFVISEDRRTELERERAALLAGGNKAGPAMSVAPKPPPVATQSIAPVPVPVISMSDEEFEALTGQSAGSLPAPPGAEGEDQASSGGLPSSWTAAPAALGGASQYKTNPTWYYRVLSPNDPTAQQILKGAGLTPRAPDPGYSFQPAANQADMTFRHLRPGGNVPQTGTDRISTAKDLEAFQTLLKDRGTGELVRVDPEAARRMGAEFLQHGEIMADLDEIGMKLSAELDAARHAGRGKTHIARLESRIRALEAAKTYARSFQEGQGVGGVPSKAMTPVKGANLGEAVAGERALMANLKYFRYGGRVLIVIGVVMSVARVASAPPEQQARIAAREAGGWAFSLAGGAAGAKAGAALGAAVGIESGPGAIVTAVLGALIGGALGFFFGEEVADEVYDMGERTAERLRGLGDPSKFVEGSVQMFGSAEDKRRFYEMRAIESGEEEPEY